MSEDRIEKNVVIRAPRNRVWKALTDSQEFGRWFGCRFESAFVVGTTVRGVHTGSELATKEENARHPYLGQPIEFRIVELDPPKKFAYRWQSLESRPDPNTVSDVWTLVEFTLEDAADGTRLTVVESGFSQVPTAHRKSTYDSHDGGWAIQVQRIRVHIEQG